MPNWTLALAIGAATMLLASAWIWLFELPRHETRNGLKALASMSWREFSGVVLAALRQRGFTEAAEPEARSAPETQPERLLVHGDEQWLLACKHGSAYRFGPETMIELAEAVRLRGATGAFLATQGQVGSDGLRAARERRIEVLSDARLWQAAKPQMPAILRSGVVDDARRRALRHTGIAALAGVALTAVIAFLVPAGVGTDTPAAPAARHVVAAPAQASQTAQAEEAPFVTDEAALQRQREAVSKALTASPGIIRGFWISKLTLVIDRSGDDATVWAQVCRELERYPSLRTSRVQLNPRAGTDDLVRWRQCKTM